MEHNKIFTDKELELYAAITKATQEYEETVDQKEKLNEHALISELVGTCSVLTYEIFKQAYSGEMKKLLETINVRNLVPFERAKKK